MVGGTCQVRTTGLNTGTSTADLDWHFCNTRNVIALETSASLASRFVKKILRSGRDLVNWIIAERVAADARI